MIFSLLRDLARKDRTPFVDLRQRLEGLLTCALHHAKPDDYSALASPVIDRSRTFAAGGN
jgi:hypothetical protein